MRVQGDVQDDLEAFSRVDKGFSNRKVRRKQLANRCGIIFLKKAYVRDSGLTQASLGSFVKLEVISTVLPGI